MHPVLLQFGPFTIYSYGVMVALAFLLGILMAMYLAKRNSILPERILDLAVYVIISAVLGARLLYVILFWRQFQQNPLEIIMIHRGGLVFLGGLLAALLAVFFYAKRNRISLLVLLDILTPATAIGYAIGRVGCFLNGCCFGLPTTLPWGVVFPDESLAGQYFRGVHLHPTQLYATFAMLVVFGILLLILKHRKFEGEVFYFGIIFYSLYRFVNEFFRLGPHVFLGLTPSQLIAIVMFCLVLYPLFNKLFKKDES